MIGEAKKIEQQRIKRLIRKYEKDGFDVQLNPRPSSLPKFFGDYTPDLVVRRGDETIVIEVTSRSTMSEMQDMWPIAARIDKQPGWEFELIVTNPRQPVQVVDVEPDFHTLQIRLEEVRILLDKGLLESAALLAWSVLEGVFTSIAITERIKLSNPSPSYLIKKMYSLGVVNVKEKKDLNLFHKIRNQVSHGVTAPKLSRKRVEKVLIIAEQVLSEPRIALDE